ncbi:hypothetical protein QJU23_03555 [Pasteurella atlantica]|uniref:Uncharacterized protein n=2 Tax=Pasteurellaceae TaxID=712 RepID=A0ACC6HKX8_9PAST|nr:hypothetical protein [Pasteurella atlantica]
MGSYANQYYGNGYTIINEHIIEQSDDINVLIYKNITASTVKDGLQQLLDGTGWQLADHPNIDPYISRLYNQKYPNFKRKLNPIPLNKALSYIAGNAWDLVVDPVNKLISFQLKDYYSCSFLSEEKICTSK